VKVGHPEWLPSKQISILVQFSLNRHPELPDIPTAVDLATRSDEERKILSAIMVAAEVRALPLYDARRSARSAQCTGAGPSMRRCRTRSSWPTSRGPGLRFHR